MKPLSKATRGDFAQRIQALRPESERLWGTMSPAAMLAHLEVAFRGTIQDGIPRLPDRSNLFVRLVIKPLILYVLPMPKGVKVPDRLTPEPTASFEELRETVLALMDEFIAAATAHPTREVMHPKFGMLNMKEWSQLHAKHLDHHLRQFGV